MAGLFAEARQWAQGRWWQWRALLLLFLAWDGARHLRDPEAGGLFAGITFGVHEFGHLLFAFFGEVMTAAGGSLNQLLIPIGAGFLLYHYRDFFGIAVAGTWLSSSLLDLARYIGDARAQELDLVGFGEDPQHDWTFLLGHFNALASDTRLAGLTRGAGLLVLLLSLGFGVWVCLQMAGRAGVGAPARD
jgi:hypothetical protein